MDASELEIDAKLYKASGELLSELLTKLPSLVENPSAPGSVRRWVIETKIYSVNSLLDRFQEWPQLLDPHLAGLIQILVDAFLEYCIVCPQDYIKEDAKSGEICPLPRAVCRVLYTFCKVRGHKVIIRLLNNEPKYVEPILSSFRLWSLPHQQLGTRMSPMIWEEKYIMLLWLSHLMLAPFELSSISNLAVETESCQFDDLSRDLPAVAQSLLELTLEHLQVPSKAREAATTLAVRLSLRRDMQAFSLPERLATWSVTQLNSKAAIDASSYQHIGLLSLLFGLLNSGSDLEVAPFVNQIFRLALDLTISTQPLHAAVRESAPARKLLIKIMRSAVIHAISLSSKDSSKFEAVNIEALLEDCIQVLLEYLSDNDTPVRQAASKALSLVALRLNADMSAEVGEAVLGCLEENMLLVNTITGELVAATDISREDAVAFKKNVNAVNALQWHGAMLTLGHLLFRRALPLVQLPNIIEALLIGLEFEQRSSVGTSLGVGVRDAACFGIWSLARKYSTVELAQVPVSASMLIGDLTVTNSGAETVLQTIATHLVVSACLDPSGNLRRGSSAALQELIGRHPDVIIQGIPVVQVVDYHAVARRSRAMTEVTVAAAQLDVKYHHALVYSLLQWRGAKATDAGSRRLASHAMQDLTSSISQEVMQIFLTTLLTEISSLKSSNRGSNAAARHGYLLAFASTLGTLRSRSSNEIDRFFQPVLPFLTNLLKLTGDIDGRATTDLDNVFEATSAVIATAAALVSVLEISKPLEESSHFKSWTSQALSVLDRCTTATEKDIVTESAATANVKVFEILDEASQSSLIASWLDPDGQRKTEFACKGRIVTFGLLFESLSNYPAFQDLRINILKYFCTIVESKTTIETKVNAMQSIGRVMKSPRQWPPSEGERIIATIAHGLADYTIDRRGDVGSLLRLEAIGTASVLLDKSPVSEKIRPVLQLLVKLATEKLVKVRFLAWSCVKQFWSSTGLFSLQKDFRHQADVSSQEYFETLLQLLNVDYLHDSLILGLISSSAAGTDDISRACTEAIVSSMHEQEAEVRNSLISSMINFILRYLGEPTGRDDREVVPALDFLVFILEHVLPLTQAGNPIIFDSNEIWQICQHIHGQSATILRLEALIRLYSALLNINDLQMRAADRLTRMLLHRWPKIRTLAAEGIYAMLCPSSIVQCDWNAPVTASKPIVLQLRKNLGVAGIAAK